MTSKFISTEQIVKANAIEDDMYGAEVAGGHKVSFNEPEEPKYDIFLLILKGKISCKINNSRHDFRQGQFIHLPTWAAIGWIEFSHDFHGTIVAVKNDIIIDIFRSRSPFPHSFAYRLQGIINCPELVRHEKKIIAGDMRNLIGAIGNKKHHYLEELAYAQFYILMIDIADIIWNKYGQGDPGHNAEMSRQDSLMKEFMELAMAEAGCESNIDFYADTLCISRQYLSMIVKEKIGVSIGACLARIRYEKNAETTERQVIVTETDRFQNAFL